MDMLKSFSAAETQESHNLHREELSDCLPNQSEGEKAVSTLIPYIHSLAFWGMQSIGADC